MAEINLLRNELQTNRQLSLNRAGKIAAYIVITLVILEGLFYGGLLLYEYGMNKKIMALEQENANTDLEISKTEKDRLKAIALQSRIKGLDLLLDQHIFWSEIFKELEKVTYKQAKFSGLEGDEGEQRIIVSGEVASYEDLAKLILGLKTSGQIKDVTLENSALASGEEQVYSFSLELKFDPKILQK